MRARSKSTSSTRRSRTPELRAAVVLRIETIARSRRSSGRSPWQPCSRACKSASVALFVGVSSAGRSGLSAARRSRRRAALNPLLPAEETPTKSATLADLQALEHGCHGDRPLDLRDRAIVSILKTTAARNSGVRLLRLEDLDFERALIRFRRGKGGKSLDVALQPETRAALLAYLDRGRPTLVE